MLSQTGIYALRAMGYLAVRGRDTPIMSGTIAEDVRIPKNFLSKILHRMAQAGLVRSVRGKHGGFVLEKNPSEIRVRDVLAPFMKTGESDCCCLGLNPCNGKCGLHERWREMARQYEKMLDETTIADILRHELGRVCVARAEVNSAGEVS